MEKIIVDSSVVVKWFVPEHDSGKAELIFQDYQKGGFELLAPSIIYSEIGNIIWKEQNFQNLSASNADDAIKAFQKLAISTTSTTVIFDDAYRIAIKHKRSFYDSLYLALAERENCAFVTADEKLFNAVRADFSKMIWLANWK